MTEQALLGGLDPKEQKRLSRQDQAAQDLLNITEPIRRQLVVKARQIVKDNVLADADMWQWVRSGLGAALDQAMDDVELEIERTLHSAMLRAVSEGKTEGPSGRYLMWLWYKFRAWVLHHYLPHDIYIFTKLKDPVYLVIAFLAFLPIHGLRITIYAVLLVMLAYPSPPDEYQLINFIVMCKGMQFLTSGVMQTFSASLSYYYCFSTHKDDLLACNDSMGPGATGKGLAIDYLGSIALVWIAFALLKRAKRHGDPLRMKRESQQTATSKEQLDDEAGGRLRSLLAYDRRCFYVTVMLLAALSLATCADCWLFDGTPLSLWESALALVESPQFSANIFWCCVLYSVLSAPFFPFIIPALQTTLCHCDPTGFNEQGACVSFVDPVQKKTEEETRKKKAAMNFAGPAKFATNVLSIINEGRRARDPNAEDWEYKFGDFTRGVFTKLTKKKPAEVEPDVEEGTPSSSIASSKNPFRLFGKRREKSGTTDDEDAEEGKEAGASQSRLDEQYKALVAGPSGDALPVASLRIPGTYKTQDGVTMFRLEVDMGPGKDAGDAAVAAERVVTAHRFSDFKKLSHALGQRCLEFPEAKFPPYYMIPATKAKLEQRRAGLEGWLQRVVRDEEVSSECGHWSAIMRVFLAPSDDVQDVDAELLPASPEGAAPPQDDPVALAAATAAELRNSAEPPTAAAAMMQDVAGNLQMLSKLAEQSPQWPADMPNMPSGDELVARMAEVTEQLRNVEAPQAPQWAAQMVEKAPSNAELMARVAEVTAQLPPAPQAPQWAAQMVENAPSNADLMARMAEVKAHLAPPASWTGALSSSAPADSAAAEAAGSSFLSKMQQVVAVGRQARGEEEDGEYRFGDFSRGLWARMQEGKRETGSGDSEIAAGGSSAGPSLPSGGLGGGPGREHRSIVEGAAAPPVKATDSALPLDYEAEASASTMPHVGSPAKQGSADAALTSPSEPSAGVSAIDEAASPAVGDPGQQPGPTAASGTVHL